MFLWNIGPKFLAGIKAFPCFNSLESQGSTTSFLVEWQPWIHVWRAPSATFPRQRSAWAVWESFQMGSPFVQVYLMFNEPAARLCQTLVAWSYGYTLYPTSCLIILIIGSLRLIAWYKGPNWPGCYKDTSVTSDKSEMIIRGCKFNRWQLVRAVTRTRVEPVTIDHDSSRTQV